MFLEWETTAGNYKSSAGNDKLSARNFKAAENFKITLLTTSNKFHWANGRELIAKYLEFLVIIYKIYNTR